LQTVRHRINIYPGSCVPLTQTRYTLWRNTASIMKGLGYWMLKEN